MSVKALLEEIEKERERFEYYINSPVDTNYFLNLGHLRELCIQFSDRIGIEHKALRPALSLSPSNHKLNYFMQRLDDLKIWFWVVVQLVESYEKTSRVYDLIEWGEFSFETFQSFMHKSIAVKLRKILKDIGEVKELIPTY